MKQHISNRQKCITLLILMMAALTAGRAQAQCSWQLTATAEPSTCSRNGKVTAVLTQSGYSGILYRLQSLTTVFQIAERQSPVFTDLPPDRYRLVAYGECNQQEDSISYDITVTGNYTTPTIQITQKRSALQNCPTGQLWFSATNGRAPYTIRMTSRPVGYTGDTIFVTNSPGYTIDKLNAGSYSFVVSDACSYTSPAQNISVPQITIDNLQFNVSASMHPLGNDCNVIFNLPPNYLTSDQPYGDVLSYTYSFNGSDTVPYKSIYVTGGDTIRLPQGQTFKDVYGKQITYYIKASCGPQKVVTATIPTPGLYLYSNFNCSARAYDVTVGVNNSTFVCFPVTYLIKNNSTSVEQTLVSNNGWSLQLPYGIYTVTATDKNGYLIGQNTSWVLAAPDLTNPYTISAADYDGDAGNEGACFFTLDRPSGIIPDGTTVELISASNGATFFATLNQQGNRYFITQPDNGDIFTPGTYQFRVVDGCIDTSYLLPITVDTTQVYYYNWKVDQNQSCSGMTITPSGTARFQGKTWNTYYQIQYGPPGGYNPNVVKSGTVMPLTISGNYYIGVSVLSFYVYPYYWRNIKTISYIYGPLNVDVDKTFGWVCPNLPADSGYITISATGGQKGPSSVYTYKLFNHGQVGTGLPLAVNNTGKFSTSAAAGQYVITKDSTYDILLSDECGASYVQSITIVDLATAQIAFADKPEYCIGDAINLSVINLPTTAVQYQWTGPNGFTSTDQYAWVDEVTTSSGGKYAVTVSSDICLQPIKDTIDIVLAAYITSCYSAVTDTSVNPYVYGLLGIWRPSQSYTYYAARAESDPAQETNIRKDGTFAEFTAFWQRQTDGWKKQTTDTNWVWTTRSTLFNKRGFELENKDALNRYNGVIYGYGNSLPVAAIQNSHYCESAYDGFEDYRFDVSGCPDGTCPPERRFTISGAAARIVDTEKHTGRYSLRVSGLDGDSIAVMLPVTTAATEPADLTFNTSYSWCPPYSNFLDDVRADKSVLLPPVSLLSNKKVMLSAWVKEEADCKCTSYEGTDIKFVVKGSAPSVAIIAHPAGAIIDGWQRYEQVLELPDGTDTLSVILQVGAGKVAYFDDIRLHPYNANMKSFVYDPQTMRLMAELDENNYATFYEYDDDGVVTRLKKETERGIKTIRETRNAMIKETVPDDPNIDK